jgi:putative tributyrin esterase
LSLARTLPLTASLQIWVDTGQDDPWATRALLLHDVLSERGITHAWHLYPGGHDWDYWGAHVAEYLRFYSHALTH